MLFGEKCKNYAVILFAEFLGTFLLMFFGCMGSIVLYSPFGAISFALTILASIQIFGHISGAHFNPSVTIAACIVGKLELIRAPFYIVTHFLGAFSGYGVLSLLINTNLKGSCVTVPVETTNIQALFIEMIITGTFILTLCSVWDIRNIAMHDSSTLRITFILMCIFMVSSPSTGASLSTPRSLAPAVFNNIWKGHWVYWVGPNTGAAIGALLYKYVFDNPQ